MRTIRVKVKPNAHTCGLEEMADGTWLAHVKAAPVDGKANEELLRVVAEHFGVRKAQVTLKSGASSRMKVLVLP